MANGIPLPLVRANQWFIVAIGLISFLLHWRAGVLFGLVVLLVGRLGGPRCNLTFLLARRLLGPERLQNAPLEDAGSQRFNQALAIVFFAVGAAGLYLIDQPTLAWGAILAVVAAAFLATRGFCIGCTLYYQLKRRGWIHRSARP